jgi:CrcB protein
MGISKFLGEKFPWGTLCVNVLGSFLLGAILAAGSLSEGEGFSFASMQAFLGVGFCGGLTTFSTFSLQNLSLLSQRGRLALAANILASVGLCLLAVAAGYSVMERWAA